MLSTSAGHTRTPSSPFRAYPAEAARSEAHRQWVLEQDPFAELDSVGTLAGGERVSASKSGHSATPIRSLDVATRNRVGVDAPPTSSEPVWTDAVQFVGGRAFPQDEHTSPFDRLSASAAAGVGPAVWQLSEMSTGLYLRFATDAHLISLRWTLRTVCAEKWPSGCHLPEMPDSGTNSFDTYVAHPFQSQHCESKHGVSRPNPNYQHVFRSNHNF